MRRLPVLLCLAVLVLPLPALAHKLKVFAAVEGGDIVGSAYFAGGGKAMEVEGQVIAGDGAIIARFRTDIQGEFRVAAPSGQALRIHVDAGDGHVAEATLGVDEIAQAPANAAPANTADIEAAVARQIIPLRKQIDAMEERARFSDIMGGLGTIFGLFGIAAWVQAHRKTKP
jgi:nickel transport protein